MDFISLYYFTEAAKDLHFTKTADRLYISQQTLSNHIKRLELYFGVLLFERKPSLALTCAGEFVLSFAQRVIKDNTNLQDVLFDISNQERGLLRIGASMPRANTFLPKVLPEFSHRYPNVEIRVIDGISSKLEKMIEMGDIDFAVVLAEKQEEMVSRHLLDDSVCLCVSDQLLKRYYGDETEALKERAIHGAEVQDFACLPFCMPSNRLGAQLRRCFEEARCHINTYLTATYSYLAISICSQGLAACFSTQLNLVGQMRDMPDNINIFPVFHNGKPLIQELALIRHKDRYLSGYSKHFLELTFRFFKELKQLDFTHKV